MKTLLDENSISRLHCKNITRFAPFYLFIFWPAGFIVIHISALLLLGRADNSFIFCSLYWEKKSAELMNQINIKSFHLSVSVSVSSVLKRKGKQITARGSAAAAGGVNTTHKLSEPPPPPDPQTRFRSGR